MGTHESTEKEKQYAPVGQILNLAELATVEKNRKMSMSRLRVCRELVSSQLKHGN